MNILITYPLLINNLSMSTAIDTSPAVSLRAHHPRLRAFFQYYYNIMFVYIYIYIYIY